MGTPQSLWRSCWAPRPPELGWLSRSERKDGPGDTEKYDDNGNQTSRGSDTFAYDHENRLTQAVIGGNTSTYAYNGDGLRMSRTAGGSTANYTWDVAAGLPVVLQDGTNTYVYGLDLIASVTGSTPTYYLYDGLGSTRGLTNSQGQQTVTYSYDAFGAMRTQTGSSSNYWLYTGEQRDTQSWFYYLRARYYDPAIGRFITQDPFMGSATAPLSLNRYPYVLNNLLRWLDPWGLRNVEGTPFATPTPTPPGMVQVCVRVTPEGCEWTDKWVEIPRGGHDFALFPAIKELLVQSSGWFNNTRPGNITRAFVGGTVATAGAIGLATPGLEWTAPILIPAGYQIAFGGPPGQPPFENCF